MDLRKACDACHTSKVRCIPTQSAQDDASSSSQRVAACQRCIRLAIPCKFSPPEVSAGSRKRRRKSPSDRTTTDAPRAVNGIGSERDASQTISNHLASPSSTAHSDPSFDFISSLQRDLDVHNGAETSSQTLGDLFPNSRDDQFMLDPSDFFLPSNGFGLDALPLMSSQQVPTLPLAPSPTILSNISPKGSSVTVADLSSSMGLGSAFVPITLPAFDQVMSQPTLPTSIGDFFTTLTTISCTLQTSLRDLSNTPLLSTIAKIIEILSALCDKMCSIGIPPPDAAADSSCTSFPLLHTYKSDEHLQLSNVFMLFFSVSFQIIGALSCKLSIPELSPPLINALLPEEQANLRHILIRGQARLVDDIMKRIESHTIKTHKRGTGESDGEGGPCLVRMMARSVQHRVKDLQDGLQSC